MKGKQMIYLVGLAGHDDISIDCYDENDLPINGHGQVRCGGHDYSLGIDVFTNEAHAITAAVNACDAMIESHKKAIEKLQDRRAEISEGIGIEGPGVK